MIDTTANAGGVRRAATAFAIVALTLLGLFSATEPATAAESDWEPCLTAECQSPWWDPWKFPNDEELEYEPYEPIRYAHGEGSDAMAEAFDEAGTECPGGFKILDTEWSGSVFTLTYMCN